MSSYLKSFSKFLIPILLFGAMCSHDMFLKTNIYFLQKGEEFTIRLFNGTYEKSENVIDRNRMLDVSLVGNGKRRTIDTIQWYEKNKETLLPLTAEEEGTFLLGVSTKARNIEMNGEDFNKYLEHDGVLDLLEKRKKENKLSYAAVEKYSKHVKIIYQVGDKKTEDWNTVLNYPIEFVPLENPYDLHPGHTLKVKLLRNGNPVPNQLVYVGLEEKHFGGHSHGHDGAHEDATAHEHTHNHGGEEHSHSHSHQDSASHDHEHAEDTHTHDNVTQLRTDSNGVVEVNLNQSGIWYLRTIYMEEVEDETLTHESNWTTLTFAIGDSHDHHHDHEDDHNHEEGNTTLWFILASVAIIGGLFFFFNSKKKSA